MLSNTRLCCQCESSILKTAAEKTDCHKPQTVELVFSGLVEWRTVTFTGQDIVRRRRYSIPTDFTLSTLK